MSVSRQTLSLIEFRFLFFCGYFRLSENGGSHTCLQYFHTFTHTHTWMALRDRQNRQHEQPKSGAWSHARYGSNKHLTETPVVVREIVLVKREGREVERARIAEDGHTGQSKENEQLDDKHIKGPTPCGALVDNRVSILGVNGLVGRLSRKTMNRCYLVRWRLFISVSDRVYWGRLC